MNRQSRSTGSDSHADHNAQQGVEEKRGRPKSLDRPFRNVSRQGVVATGVHPVNKWRVDHMS